MRPILYIFGGLPGSGKSILSKLYATRNQLTYLRIDTIEHVLKNSLTDKIFRGPEGYEVAYKIAKDNLKNGMGVIADSVNPLELTRTEWRSVARETNATFVEVEIICSDKTEHKKRIENRSSDISGFHLPTWEKVMNRNYEPWTSADITIDTANLSIEESFKTLEKKIQDLLESNPKKL